VTSIVLTPFRDADQAWSTVKAPYTSQTNLDRSRSIKHLHPGVDPLLSMSRVVEADMGKLHMRLSFEVRELLAWYRKVDPEFDLLDQSSTDTRTLSARKLIRYFTQPFKVTEPFRGTTGLAASRHQMLEEVRDIMSNLTP
jgi:F0F1-type ATP synthase beta subunit